MNTLHSMGLYDFVVQQVKKDVPLLGICLGMQLLGRRSDEGELEGLGLIPFETVRFQLENTNLKIPHMGWDGMLLISKKIIH